MRENNSSTSEHPSSGAPMASAPHPHRSISFVHRLLLPLLLLTSLVHSPDLGIAASAVPSDAAEVPAGPGGEFEIEWAQAPVPARLHRAEILLNSGLDAQGKRMALGVPASLAHGDGRLFLASNSEPSVFGRDPAGGGLAFERVSAGVSDDHGDDLSTATPVAIPSNTDGEITRGGDRDYFRIDVAEAGIVSFETTGNTDTFGTLYDSDGTVIGQDDESGPGPNNFRLADVVLFERTYFLEVRGYSSRTEGEYRMRVSGDARGTMTPVATAPSVSIDAIPSGNEGTTVRLGATLSGGAYDGAVEYAWTVDGGVLDSASSATTTWTRPSVSSNTNHTVGLTVTVRGTGTNAESGTSDTASASRDAFVSSVAPALPVADAPAVSINPIPAGNEGTTVRLGAALTGGTYDRGVEYAWTVDDGTLDNAGSATPTWTRPSVDSNTNHTVRLTITVRGSGANARNGTSDTASTSRTALVRNVAVALPAADAPSVSINAIADGDEATTVQLGANVTGGTYDGAVEYDWSVNGGTLNDATLATPTWTRPTVSANTNYTVNLTVTVDGTGTAARNGTSDTASASASATVRDMPRLTITTLASNLTIPWDLDFTPDGTMLFTERAGKLSAPPHRRHRAGRHRRPGRRVRRRRIRPHGHRRGSRLHNQPPLLHLPGAYRPRGAGHRLDHQQRLHRGHARRRPARRRHSRQGEQRPAQRLPPALRARRTPVGRHRRRRHRVHPAGQELARRQGAAGQPVHRRRRRRQPVRGRAADLQLRPPQHPGPRPAPRHAADVGGGARPDHRRRDQPAGLGRQLRLGSDPARQHLLRGRPHDGPHQVPGRRAGQVVVGKADAGHQRRRLPRGGRLAWLGGPAGGRLAEGPLAAPVRVQRGRRPCQRGACVVAEQLLRAAAHAHARPRWRAVPDHVQRVRSGPDPAG